VPAVGSVGLVLAVAQRHAGKFGQQVGPARPRLRPRSDCGGFLLGGELPGGACRRPRRSARTGDGQGPGWS
jgi:hypothetical protein